MKSAGAALATAAAAPGRLLAGSGPETAHTRAIPSTGERIPAVGMGTWVTFNVGRSVELRDHRTGILRVFFEKGGGMIDCSPMYGSSADVVGYGLRRLEDTGAMFAAEKVWTWFGSKGRDQVSEQRRRWGVDAFDLVQVHNLVSWKEHLDTLRALRDEGRVRYVGVTTSHGRRHGELEEILKRERLDFVQLSYNIVNRKAENRLLPLAADRGTAVIANRPFMHKQLFRIVGDRPLPAWAADIDCANWAQFFLKFVISHPHVTCAIPATSQVPHMHENMGALYGRLPDAETRRRMAAVVEGP